VTSGGVGSASTSKILTEGAAGTLKTVYTFEADSANPQTRLTSAEVTAVGSADSAKTYAPGVTLLKSTNAVSAKTTTESASNVSTVRAIDTTAGGDYEIYNSFGGTISATHAGVGAVNAIDAGGNVENLLVDNAGTISATRSSAITLAKDTSSAYSTQNTGNLAWAQTGSISLSGTSFTPVSIGAGGAIYSQEELESLTIINRAGGVIEGTGTLNPAIYNRAAEFSLSNAGTIRTNTTGSSYAIGAVGDSGGDRVFDFDNS